MFAFLVIIFSSLPHYITGEFGPRQFFGNYEWRIMNAECKRRKSSFLFGFLFLCRHDQASVAAVVAAPLAGKAVLARVLFFTASAFGNIDEPPAARKFLKSHDLPASS
jgi:hypothetical protein